MQLAGVDRLALPARWQLPKAVEGGMTTSLRERPALVLMQVHGPRGRAAEVTRPSRQAAATHHERRPEHTAYATRHHPGRASGSIKNRCRTHDPKFTPFLVAQA